MLGSNYSVACAGCCNQVRPSGRIIVTGRKPFGLGHVVLVGNLPVVEGPAFAHAVHGIDAPVNEDAKLGVFEPLHFGSSIFFNGNGPLLLAGGRNQTGGQNGRKY